MEEKELLKWLFKNKPEFRIGDRVWFIKDGEIRTDRITGIKVVEKCAVIGGHWYMEYEYSLNKVSGGKLRLFESEESPRCYIDYMCDKLHESETE